MNSGPRIDQLVRELRPDALVQKLRPDPSEGEGNIRLVGLLSTSPEQGRWRLYVSADLDEYVEIREEDIQHSLSLGEELSAVGGTMLWVKPDTMLTYSPPTARPAGAEQEEPGEYLRGEIAARNLPVAGISGMLDAAGQSQPGRPAIISDGVTFLTCAITIAYSC
jgi:hypothetical protein